MGSVLHIAELAILLFVAYALGWGIGYVARLATARGRARPATAVVEVAAAAPAEALVKAPVVAPVSSKPLPEMKPAAPARDESAVPAAAPAGDAEQLSQTSVVVTEPPAAAVEALAASALAGADAPTAPERGLEPDPEPVVASEPAEASIANPAASGSAAEDLEPSPAEPAAAMPASAPGMPWTGTIKGHEASHFAPPAAAEESAEIEAPGAALAAVALPAEAAAPVVEQADGQQPATPQAPVHPELDEDAAMRAIEGGWSRRAARALPDAPELSDLGAAVAAAQVAVEQVLADRGLDSEAPVREQATFGRPGGLPHPRNGLRDDLKRIEGIGSLDEVALNNLGIYHFDQVAAWTEREVLWLENHAFARGRIGRENWQAKARTLAADAAPLGAAR